MKSTILVQKPSEVLNRLATLGLTAENLMEVVDAMVGAKNSCTDNDAPGAPGLLAWLAGTRRMREVFLPQGWERNDDRLISSIYSPERGIKVVVCNTDAGTGVETSTPQNNSKKGAATEQAVSINQGTFKGILDAALNVIQLSDDAGGLVYWYLCVYSVGDVVRAELSCPSRCENGFFKEFRERVILRGSDGDEGGIRVRRTSPQGSPDFEVNVTRKQA
jgi:hypothetical protein